MAKKLTILSAAIIMAEILMSSTDVTNLTETIIPVAGTDLKGPYVVFRRSKLATQQVANQKSADSALIEIQCVSPDYDQSLELAEAVREALDGTQITSDDETLVLRSCFLSDSKEYWADDGYVQLLIFTVKI